VDGHEVHRSGVHGDTRLDGVVGRLDHEAVGGEGDRSLVDVPHATGDQAGLPQRGDALDLEAPGWDVHIEDHVGGEDAVGGGAVGEEREVSVEQRVHR